MGWMLIAVVFGAPVSTGIVYKSVEECFYAGDELTLLYLENYNKHLKPPSERQAELSRIPKFTCVPSPRVGPQ